MKALPPALQKIADAVPLAQPVAAEDLETLVKVLAVRFGLDPVRAARDIRGSSTLARLMRAACSVPVPPRRRPGRPKKSDYGRDIALASRIDPHTRPEASERAALKAFAKEHSLEEDAVRKRKQRLAKAFPVIL